MTLKVVIKNEGNNAGDVVCVFGLKEINKNGDYVSSRSADISENRLDTSILRCGQEITIQVPTDHFAKEKSISFKGKHG